MVQTDEKIIGTNLPTLQDFYAISKHVLQTPFNPGLELYNSTLLAGFLILITVAHNPIFW